ncbi:MAG: exonuclease III [Roseivirga sp.]|jgi:exonuclease III
MKTISRFSIIIWYGISLLVYASVLVSPAFFKFSGLISLVIPVILILNLIWFIGLVFSQLKKSIYPLILLLIGVPFLKSTLTYHVFDTPEKHIKVLSYNMMRMNKGGGKKGETTMLDWLKSDNSDIRCYQEFFGTKDVIKEISNNGEYNSFVGGYGNSFAIFSKYKIINTGVLYESSTTNNILFADLKVGKDTLRVYNVHLQSMSINPDKELNQDAFDKNYESVRKKFEIGSAKRATQVEDLLKHISQCNYPVLVVGDFNDIPYSYTYTKLSRNFGNAFEEAGRGFGFTYNGKIPFLRIDHHFFSDELNVHSFETLNQIDFSDHFPVVGIYSISN